MAKADGPLTDADRAAVAEALGESELPDGISAGTLIASSYDLDALIAQITSKEARDVAFAACMKLAHANRVCLPKQQAILSEIERAWAIPQENKTLLGRIVSETYDTVWPTELESTADRAKPEAK